MSDEGWITFQPPISWYEPDVKDIASYPIGEPIAPKGLDSIDWDQLNSKQWKNFTKKLWSLFGTLVFVFGILPPVIVYILEYRIH